MKRHRRWLFVAVLVSIALIAATGFRRLIDADSTLWGVLQPLDLSMENVLAAWWSGMLLFLASVHAYDGAERMKARAREASTSGSRNAGSGPDTATVIGAARAWTTVAGILLFFSVDEVGSIHERVGALAWPLGYSEFAMYGVLALVVGGLAIFALRGLWRVPDQRGSALGLFVGFGLLASVAIQEYLEHTAEWLSLFDALRVALEEGTELVGMLLILFVTMPHTVSSRPLPGDSDPFGPESPIPLAALRRPGLKMVLFGLVVCVGLALLTAVLSDQQRGHPADWFAAVGFLGAALIELRRDICPVGQDSDTIVSSDGARIETPARRRLRRALAAIGIVASAAAVAVGPADLIEVGPVWLNVRLTLLSAIVGVVAILGYSRLDRSQGSKGGTRSRRAHVLLGATALVAAGVGLVFSKDLFLSYLFTTLLGFGCYVATAAQTQTSSG